MLFLGLQFVKRLKRKLSEKVKKHVWVCDVNVGNLVTMGAHLHTMSPTCALTTCRLTHHMHQNISPHNLLKTHSGFVMWIYVFGKIDRG